MTPIRESSKLDWSGEHMGITCPKCGGPLWDNRPKKASGEFKPNSPDFKCKNKECQHVIWPEGEEKVLTEKQAGPKTAAHHAHENLPPSVDIQIQRAGSTFRKAWSEATEIMKTLMPEKDAQAMDVKDWYDLKLRIAQGITIEVNRRL